MDPNLATAPDRSTEPAPSLSREHIVRAADTCGGKPRIAGHRIRVQDVVLWHDRMGMSPEGIVVEYAGLTLADVHAALAFNHDHKDEIDADLRDEAARAAELEARLPSLSGQIMAGRDAADHPIPSR